MSITTSYTLLRYYEFETRQNASLLEERNHSIQVIAKAELGADSLLSLSWENTRMVCVLFFKQIQGEDVDFRANTVARKTLIQAVEKKKNLRERKGTADWPCFVYSQKKIITFKIQEERQSLLASDSVPFLGAAYSREGGVSSFPSIA